MNTPQPGAVEAVQHPGQQASLVDLLDRLLGTGVVLNGDLIISIAGVDLVEIRLAAIISSIRPELTRGQPE